MRVGLGWVVKDTITGFQGTVTGRTEYLTGCNQVLVVGKAKKDGTDAPAAWFDEQRVVRVGKTQVVLDNSKTPGFDRPAPIR